MKKKNKILAVGVILCMLFSLAVMSAYAAGGTGSDNLTWDFRDNILTISGTGDMNNYSYDNLPSWHNYWSSINKIVIKDGVTSIGAYAFFQCRVTSVTISNSVVSIGDFAFGACPYIHIIGIPKSVTSIGIKAFANTENLASIDVSNANPAYTSQNGVLFNKDKTTIICCPRALPREYIIPDGVTNIGECAFSGCKNLTSVTIPNGVENIGIHAFSDCKMLTSVTIPNGVENIGNFAFYFCEKVNSVSIPNSVKSIGDYAFHACNNLTDVYYGGSKEDWNNIQMGVNNEYLTNATMHYEKSSPIYMGISCTASVINGNIVLQTEGDREFSDENLHVAIYSEDDILLDYIIVPQFGKFNTINTVFHDIPEAKYAKVFLWDSISSLEPIAEAQRVNIIR